LNRTLIHEINGLKLIILVNVPINFLRGQDNHKTRQHQQNDKTRQDKTRQDKTRQDKTRQDKTRQDLGQDKTKRRGLHAFVFEHAVVLGIVGH
jgi:hypothetical protein